VPVAAVVVDVSVAVSSVSAAVVGVVGSLALGSALMEMLRVDPAAAAGSSHFDPDDVDALGFDDDPELN